MFEQEASKGTASALGGARLARYIGNADGSGCGGAGTVRMNYFLDSRLDRYIALAEDSVEGVLAEEDIVAMCEELNQVWVLVGLGTQDVSFGHYCFQVKYVSRHASSDARYCQFVSSSLLLPTSVQAGACLWFIPVSRA